MRSNRPTCADAETRFRVFRNISSATLAKGTPVTFATIGDSGAGVSPNGISIHLPPAVERVISLFAGIVYPDTGIPAGDYGECQVSGLCDYALVAPDAVTPISVGDFLRNATNSPFLIRYSGATYTRIAAMEAIAASGAAASARRVLLFGGA